MKQYIILLILSLGCWVNIYAQTPQKITYAYDALNRLTEVRYANGSKITYNYDVLGNRTSVVTVAATTACAVPTGMQWSNTTATSFQPRCDGVAGYSYIFRYRVNGTTTWTETAAIPCTVTGAGSVQTIFTGLTNGTYYEWQVKNVCSIGNESAYSASTFSSTFCQSASLNTPGGAQITSTSCVLNWSSFGITLKANLRWRVVGTTTWSTVNTISGTTYTLTGLLPSSNYEVQLQTICADGSLSAFSTSRTFTTLCNLPTAILSGTATITVGQSTNLSVALTGTSPWSIVVDGTTYSPTATPFIIPVSPNITKTYTITSLSNSCGTGTVSGTAVITVNAVNPCPPSASFSLGSQISGIYNAAGTIISRATLAGSTSYNAGNSITLLPGFNTPISGIFTATIKDCPGIATTNGLVLYLPFNGNANDASGNANNGTVSGASLGNDRFGVANKAYRFNDGNSITVPNSASLSLTNAFTFSMWVNMQSTTGRDGYGDINTYGYHSLFTKNCDRGQLQAAIAPASNGTFQFNVYASSAGNNPVIPFALNQWKHLAVVYDGSTLKHFVNGTMIASVTANMNLSPSNSNNLIVGKMNCWSYYFNGFLDEFRMYNRGLSNTEVLNIYHAEKP